MDLTKAFAELKDAVRASVGLLYDTTTKTCEIFSDPEFRDSNGRGSDAEAAAWIDEKHLFAAWGSPKFLDMRAILAAHPDRNEWLAADMKSWLAEVREAQARRPQTS